MNSQQSPRNTIQNLQGTEDVVGRMPTSGSHKGPNRQTFLVCAFHELPSDIKSVVVNEKTGITEQQADEYLEVVLSILRYKTGKCLVLRYYCWVSTTYICVRTHLSVTSDCR